MSTATKPQTDLTMTAADTAWGYKFGCDGLRSVVDTATFLGKSRQHVYRLIEDNKIRKGADGNICLRSIKEYAHSLES